MCCEQVAPDEHIKSEGCAHRMGAQLMAIVAEGKSGRIYIEPSADQIEAANIPKPEGIAEEELPNEPRAIWCTRYGLTKYRDLFSSRQLLALSTFSNLVAEVRGKIFNDACSSGMAANGNSLEDGGAGAEAYADAVATYLAFCVDKASDYWSAICSWHSSGEKMRNTFARQGIPMAWDFAECCPFSKSTGNWMANVDWVWKVVECLRSEVPGIVKHGEAAEALKLTQGVVISTDPPYYDNIGYADLSDFFYVWLRVALKGSHPKLFQTLLVPKAAELIASPYRFNGSKEKARNFFEEGLSTVFNLICQKQLPEYPVSVYYAFKQAEEDEDEDTGQTVASTGWETMLEALIQAGFQINGTLPVRTELTNRSVAFGTNALASSIVLICRQRIENAGVTTRREFINALKKELPMALAALKQANIAATDLAQAAIGPGMAVFSRYARVMEADGLPMNVRTALALINQTLDEVNTETEGDFDPDSRWAITWFETHGFEEGLYGEAETLSKAKNTSASGLVEAGIITSKAGKVKLIPIESLPENWNPKSDTRLTVWEATHHLIRVLETKGEEGAATLLKDMGAFGEVARDLAYRLYSICERKKWAKDALRYNGLIVSWSDVTKRSSIVQNAARPVQESFF